MTSNNSLKKQFDENIRPALNKVPLHKINSIFQNRTMQLIIFIASFVVILFAACCFIPYIGIIAILITLLLGFCVGALGIVAKMRFVWITSLLSLIAAIIALPFQLGYAIQGAMSLGEKLIESGNLVWAENIAPHIVTVTESFSPELADEARRYQTLVERVSAAKQAALDLGASPEEAQKIAMELFKKLVSLQELPIDINLSPQER